MSKACLQFASDWSTTSSNVTVRWCEGTAHPQPVWGLVQLTFSPCLGLRSTFPSWFSPLPLGPFSISWCSLIFPSSLFPSGIQSTQDNEDLFAAPASPSQALELSICQAWPPHTQPCFPSGRILLLWSSLLSQPLCSPVSMLPGCLLSIPATASPTPALFPPATASYLLSMPQHFL